VPVYKNKDKKLIIGVDLDNTLVSHPENAIKKAAKELGMEYKPEYAKDYSFGKLPEGIRNKVFEYFDTPSFATNLIVIPGSTNKLNEWKNLGHTLYIITARKGPIQRATQKYIHKHFPMVDASYYVEMGTSKAELFSKLHLDVWVDDSPVDVPEAARMRIKTCLISNSSTPYNYSIKSDSSPYISVYDKISSINFY
jgi:5'(3')-deoxyribonucleotidase